MTTTTTRPALDSGSTTKRVARLNAASLARIIDPDRDLPGAVGDGQVLPDDLLSVTPIGLDLTAEQRATLSREEVASITQSGIRFEAVLEAGFALQVLAARDLTDPRVTYLLHEMGEETRHQRLFIRLLEQLKPTAKDPLDNRLVRAVERIGVTAIVRLPALLFTLVLGGEEIPDLLQKRASEHPDTDPFIREVNRYHRQEEARHLSFARAVLPELWQKASFVDRIAVRHVAPQIIKGMFELIVHPGVYETVGLPGWPTWKAVNRAPERVALRHEATRPVLAALVDAGVVAPGRVPSGWQRLCGVGRDGSPTS